MSSTLSEETVEVTVTFLSWLIGLALFAFAARIVCPPSGPAWHTASSAS